MVDNTRWFTKVASGATVFPRTISGFLQASTIPGSAPNLSRDWFSTVIRPGCEFLRNLHLLCGSTDLDELLPYLTVLQRAERSEYCDPWVRVTETLRRLVDTLPKESVVIIDCGSSLTVCTQMALVAADYLLVPVDENAQTNDEIHAMFESIYRADSPTARSVPRALSIRVPLDTFSLRAARCGIPFPRVHSVMRLRHYERDPEVDDDEVDDDDEGRPRPTMADRWEMRGGLLQVIQRQSATNRPGKWMGSGSELIVDLFDSHPFYDRHPSNKPEFHISPLVERVVKSCPPPLAAWSEYKAFHQAPEGQVDV